MSDTIFFEIILPAEDDYTLDYRHGIETRLNLVLRAAGIGEVTGGGTGMGKANIDVEITDPERGLALIRKVLQSLEVASTAVIREEGSQSIEHPVYGKSA